MHCQNCHAPLHAVRSGFVVCPHCRYVNITIVRPIHQVQLARTAFAPIVAAMPDIIEPPAQPVRPHPQALPVLQRASRRAYIQFAAAAVASVFIFATIQNLVANYRVSHAIKLDAAGQYTQAANELSDLPSLLVLRSTRSTAQHETKQNKKWLKYLGYQDTARQLIKDKQYNQAITELQKIGKDYPTYKSVTSAIDLARSAIAGSGEISPASNTTPASDGADTPPTTTHDSSSGAATQWPFN